MKEQRTHIAYLEGLVKTEVQAHKQANVALRLANEGQTKLKGEVQDLLAQLQAALNQIQNLSMDLATTRSLLDAGAKPKWKQHMDDSGASTSKGQKWVKLEIALNKGEKTPSLTSSNKTPSRAGSEGASSRGPSISLRGAGDDGASSSSSRDNEDVPRTTWRFLR